MTQTLGSTCDHPAGGNVSGITWVLRGIIAWILLYAVVSKVLHPTSIMAGPSILHYPILFYGSIVIESFCASMVLFGSLRLAWYAAVGLFSALTPVAAYYAWFKVDCGCFGNSGIGKYSFLIDFSLLALLLATCFLWRERETGAEQRARLPISLVIGFVFAMVGATSANLEANRSQSPEAVSVLLASEWTGKSWPVAKSYHPKLSALSEGQWLVFLVNRQCSHCEEMMAQLADKQFVDRELHVVSLVSFDTHWNVHFDKIAFGEDSETKIQWAPKDSPFFAAPALFHLQDGRVVGAADGDQAEAFLKEFETRIR